MKEERVRYHNFVNALDHDDMSFILRALLVQLFSESTNKSFPDSERSTAKRYLDDIYKEGEQVANNKKSEAA